MKRSTKAERWFDEGVRHYEAGDPQKALAAFEQAEVLYRALIADNQRQYRRRLAATLLEESRVFGELSRPEDVLARCREAAELYQTLIGEGQDCRLSLASTWMNEGNALGALNRPEDALARYREAAELCQTLIGEGQDCRLNLALTRMNEGSALCNLNRPEEALTRYREAAGLCQTLIDKGHDLRSDLALTRMSEGDALLRLNRPEEALARYRETTELYRGLIAAGQTRYRPDLARTRMNEGNALLNLNRSEEALACYREAVELYQTLLAAGQTHYRLDLAHTRMNEGNALLRLNHPDEALARYREAVETYQTLVGEGQDCLSELALTWMNEGNALHTLDRPNEALARYREAVGLYENLIAAGQLQYRPNLALTWMNEGNTIRALARPKESLVCYREAAELYRDLIDEGHIQYRPNLACTRMNEGFALFTLNRSDEALARYREAADLYGNLITVGQSRYRLNLVNIRINEGIALNSLQRPADAHTCYQLALDVWEGAEAMPADALDTAPYFAALIAVTRSAVGFAARVERLTQEVARALGGVAPQNLGRFYPSAEQAFTYLFWAAISAALDQQEWDLALTVIGTARAQRLAKLAQADLLRRSAREDDPAELRKYREVYHHIAELEIRLNVKAGPGGEGITSDHGGGDEDAGQQYQTLYNEYTALRSKLDKLEQTLREQGLLPDLGAGLFDGAGLRQKLPPTAALLVLVEFGAPPAHFVVVLTRDGGQVLTMEGGSDWTRRLERITETLKGQGRTLRDGPGGDTRTASAEANATAAPPELADAQTEALTEALAEQFWKPIQDVLGDEVKTVWLLPTGDLHGLPWQASAPPDWHCRLAPAPWFVHQALDAPAAAPLCPTAAAPLDVLAYAAPDSDKELLHMALEERGMRAIWEDAAHALAGLDRVPAPPPAHLVLGGHGDSDAAIPGAARIWVGREGGEPRYVGFGELWNAPYRFLLSLYFSSCVVGRTREVNGEPLGLISAGLLRGARYLVGWSVPVDDLGAALFALLYHWLWRDCADPEAALTRARSAFLTGAWPAAAVEWAQPLLAAHLRDLLVEWIKIPSRQNVRKERLRKVLCNLYKGFGESPDVLDSWEIQLNAWRQRGAVNAASVAAETLATRILDRRAEFPFRYVGHFALGFGSTGHPPTAV